MTEESTMVPNDELEQHGKGHPKGLYLLYFTEMWERFSYYGMRGIFSLYMVKALLFDKALVSSIYSSYTGLVYLTPLIGGYIADKYWGNRRSIIVGGIMMAIGQFFMYLSGNMLDSLGSSETIMFVGLFFLIIGNGFFKPNISTMVGQLYAPGDHRVDSAFTIFYQGINMGALIAPLICGYLGEKVAFKYGFLAACIGMIISLITFIALKNKYVVTPNGESVGLPPKQAYNRKNEATEVVTEKLGPGRMIGGIIAFIALYLVFFQVMNFDVIGGLIFSASIVFSALIIIDPSLTKIERDRIWAIYIIAFFVIFFWSAFEQAGASLTFFADEQTNRTIFGWTMPASYFQSFNAGFIVILVPFAVMFWQWLDKRKKEPSSPVKQAMGLGLLALGYLYIAWGVHGVQPWEKVSMIWLIGLYFIHTVGELFLSPIGLSMVVKLSPVRLTSLLMGVWFMSNAVSNKFVGTLSSLYPDPVKTEAVAVSNPEALKVLQGSSFDTAGVWNMTADKFVNIETAKLKEIKSSSASASGKGMLSIVYSHLNSKEEKDSISEIQPTSMKRSISVYFLKLIKAKSPNFSKAYASEDGNTIYSYRKDEEKTREGTKVTESVEVWNLNPANPKFLGMEIKNLFDFFMIFVYMAGVAAILLFAIHKWLLKMMHGVR